MYYGGLADAEVIFSFAKVLGLGSALLVFFQWTPQIWKTYQMKVRRNGFEKRLCLDLSVSFSILRMLAC